MDRGAPADLLARPGYLRDLMAISHL
jgi:hypothetical protein